MKIEDKLNMAEGAAIFVPTSQFGRVCGFRVKPTDWNREPASRNQVELLDPQGGAGGRGGPEPVLQEGAATTSM